MGKLAPRVRSGAKCPRGAGSLGEGRRGPRSCSRSSRHDSGAPGRERERTAAPGSAPRRAGAGPGRGHEPPAFPGRPAKPAPLCSREGEARTASLRPAKKSEARGPGCKVGPASLRRLRRLLTAVAGCVRGPGRGWGAQGGGLGARPVAEPAVLAFPTWLHGPPRGCSSVLRSAIWTSRARKLSLLSTWNCCLGELRPSLGREPCHLDCVRGRDRDPVALGSAP